MELWQDGIVALLAAIGLSSLIWMAVRAFVCAPGPGREAAAVLIPARGDGETLEAQVQLLRCLRFERGAFDLILLVDCGLSDEGRRLGELLAQEDRDVAICRRDEIQNYIT